MNTQQGVNKHIRGLMLLASITFGLRYGDVGLAQQVVYDQPVRYLNSDSQSEFFPPLANQLTTHPTPIDLSRSKIWDNFQLTQPADVTGIEWVGAFDGQFNPEPIRGELDFLIEIWADVTQLPELSQPLAAWTLDGGLAGFDDGIDVRSQLVPDQTVVRGGQIYSYSANNLSDPVSLAPGDYWLSIVALQTFPSPNFFDPSWGWWLGSGGDSKSFRFESLVTDAEPGEVIPRDLAFRLVTNAIVMPELQLDLNQDGSVGASDIDLLSSIIRRDAVVATIDTGGFVTVHATNQAMLGIEFKSEAGALLPVGDTTANASPFDFFLANSSQQIALGTLNVGDPGKDNGTGPVVIDGSVRLPVRYDTTRNATEDLIARWGAKGVESTFPVYGADFDLNGDGSLDQLDREIWIAALPTVVGDVDLDGDVAFRDFLVLSANFSQSGGWATGDVDGDASVGFSDFLLLSANFGASAPNIAAVPEPTSQSLLLVVGAGCGVGLGRRRTVPTRSQFLC